MGVLSTILGRKNRNKKEEESFINWIPLTSLDQIKEIKELSKNEPVAIFKHSTRCGISSMVIKRFVNSFDEELKDFKVYYLDLLSYRDISNEIGYTFQVLHQSPQLLVVKKGEVISHASHYDIAHINLKNF
ncbi:MULTISPECIES: bacillithiol system redox-active protein YtxJ [Tenacibaculum]|uniref:Bacillithiol system redox-active protein YtxJ n=1 Tax=Tenacibaculum discolor TaxID=361581 RepID=A0A2G1BWV3_9FLAO|nr:MULTISPECIES: bacillithiol system redox-active protein YtxJ [Tenacibaculum]PHO00337.1 bacillithiol system redox-active protein YtxJ [Rhodobacteraceae bacterium 4F10]MDP2540579.1 bacillithiol system redox-active protein YtxJ [Tenacibaculum discolor]NVK08831.1 bacillithiol system redox-active protein YtxJ [Tenacibaculum sp.]PHN98541.1 bacillithiol system redox-active protein YtxJ [Tenacibaculum discolor]RLK02402.1 bacillithiol system protein YtxJ [Tenacibaculum discolor]